MEVQRADPWLCGGRPGDDDASAASGAALLSSRRRGSPPPPLRASAGDKFSPALVLLIETKETIVCCCFVIHGIAESQNHRLEKTSKIMKSNCQPNTTTPAKPCPLVPHPHSF